MAGHLLEHLTRILAGAVLIPGDCRILQREYVIIKTNFIGFVLNNHPFVKIMLCLETNISISSKGYFDFSFFN